MFARTRLFATTLLLALQLAWLSGQGADPRSEFLDALGLFSVSLDGTFGDEGRRLTAALDSMAKAVARWDESVRASERGMAADVATATPQFAARMHQALAGVYLNRGRVDDALKQLSAARTNDPARHDASLLQGIAHTQLTGDAKAAADALRAAHEGNPADPARSYLLARALAKANQPQAALDLLSGIRHPPDGVSQTGAAALMQLSLVPERSSAEPFLAPVRYAAGFASIHRGDLPRAIAQLRDAAQGDPLTLAGGQERFARAAAAFRKGQVQEARAELQSLVAEAPKHAEAHRLLGMVDLADGESARGIAGLRTAIALDAQNERARVALANWLMDTDRLEAAEQELGDTLKVLPHSGRARYLLGQTYRRLGKRSDAIRELQAALAEKPLVGANTVHRMVASLQQDEQALDEAAASLSTSIDFVPDEDEAHRELGRIYFLQGDDVGARAESEIALLLDPSNVDARTLLAQVHLRSGNAAEATQESLRALQIDPSHREARYVYATSLLRTGRTDEGLSEMQVFQQLQAEDAEARSRTFELGRLRREAAIALAGGDAATAVTLRQRALVIDPRAAVSHLDLGVALLRAGRAAEAADRLATATALNGPIEAHRHLADAYAALQRTEESRKARDEFERLKRESISRTGRAQ